MAHPRRRPWAYALGYVLALILAGAGGAALAGWVGPALVALVERFTTGRPGAGALGTTRSAWPSGWRCWPSAPGTGARRGTRRGPPVPGWLGAVERIGLWRAFGLGVLLLLANPDNVLAFLAVLHLTGEGAVDPALALPDTSRVVLGAAAPGVVVPLGIYRSVPQGGRGFVGDAAGLDRPGQPGRRGRCWRPSGPGCS